MSQESSQIHEDFNESEQMDLNEDLTNQSIDLSDCDTRYKKSVMQTQRTLSESRVNFSKLNDEEKLKRLNNMAKEIRRLRKQLNIYKARLSSNYENMSASQAKKFLKKIIQKGQLKNKNKSKISQLIAEDLKTSSELVPQSKNIKDKKFINQEQQKLTQERNDSLKFHISIPKMDLSSSNKPEISNKDHACIINKSHHQNIQLEDSSTKIIIKHQTSNESSSNLTLKVQALDKNLEDSISNKKVDQVVTHQVPLYLPQNNQLLTIQQHPNYYIQNQQPNSQFITHPYYQYGPQTYAVQPPIPYAVHQQYITPNVRLQPMIMGNGGVGFMQPYPQFAIPQQFMIPPGSQTQTHPIFLQTQNQQSQQIIAPLTLQIDKTQQQIVDTTSYQSKEAR